MSWVCVGRLGRQARRPSTAGSHTRFPSHPVGCSRLDLRLVWWVFWDVDYCYVAYARTFLAALYLTDLVILNTPELVSKPFLQMGLNCCGKGHPLIGLVVRKLINANFRFKGNQGFRVSLLRAYSLVFCSLKPPNSKFRKERSYRESRSLSIDCPSTRF